MLDRAARFFPGTAKRSTAVLGVIASATSFIETNEDKTDVKVMHCLSSFWRFGINDYETYANRCIPPGRNTGRDCKWEQARRLRRGSHIAQTAKR